MASIRAAAEAGITIAANPNRVEVRVDGLVIADSTRALVHARTRDAGRSVRAA